MTSGRNCSLLEAAYMGILQKEPIFGIHFVKSGSSYDRRIAFFTEFVKIKKITIILQFRLEASELVKGGCIFMVNMKKIASLFVAAAMTFTLAAVPAYAEETEAAEMVELEWTSDIEAALEEAGMTGSFYTFDDIAVQFYLPDVFSEFEVSDEQADTGMVSLFGTDDEAAAVAISRVDDQGLSLEEFKDALAQTEGISDPEIAMVNGIEMVSYTNDGTDSVGAVFATDGNEFVEFTFSPASDEGFNQVAQLIVLSIQPEEAAETEAE